jgi:hypothetical protein
MYVIGKIEVEETVSMVSLEKPALSFSLEEFELYVNLFEEMLESMDGEEGDNKEHQCTQDELDWNLTLDEFDLAEIADMRERNGLIQAG